MKNPEPPLPTFIIIYNRRHSNRPDNIIIFAFIHAETKSKYTFTQKFTKCRCIMLYKHFRCTTTLGDT